MPDTFQEKTEQPTEKRLQDARKKGQVAQSPELASCFVIIFMTVFLYYSMSKGFDKMFGVYSHYIRGANADITVSSVQGILSFAVSQWLIMVVPVFALLIALGLFSGFIQTGFMWSFEAMAPKMETLNPLKGIKKAYLPEVFFRDAQVGNQDRHTRLFRPLPDRQGAACHTRPRADRTRPRYSAS